jgi:hypothetical protein
MHHQRLSAMQITFRPATLEDAQHIGANLRAADLKELGMLSPLEPVEALEQSLNVSSWCEVAVLDGEPASIFGVSRSHLDGWGVPWMLATDKFTHVGRKTLTKHRGYVDRMQAEFGKLHNIVHAENHTAINWLRWLGFSIGTVPCGPEQQFFLFWRK